MQKIRKDDTVIVISGKDKGRTGTVLKLMLDKDNILVAGINKVKKHQKANPQAGLKRVIAYVLLCLMTAVRSTVCLHQMATK